MSSVRTAVITQVSLALRFLQALCGLVILICLFTSYRSVDFTDSSIGAVQGSQVVAAQISHFFLAMAAYSAIIYGTLVIVFEVLLGRIKIEPLLERCLDSTIAGFLLLVGLIIAPSVNCTRNKYQFCTSFQVAIVFSFLSALLFFISLALNIHFKSVKRFNPDSTENLVPRGRYGPEVSITSEVVLDSRRPKKKQHLDESDLDSLRIPRGNFGSIRSMDLTELKQYHQEYEAEDVYFNSRVDFVGMAKTTKVSEVH